MIRPALIASTALLAACTATGSASAPGRAVDSAGSITEAGSFTDALGRQAWRIECATTQEACNARAAELCADPTELQAISPTPRARFRGGVRGGFRGGARINGIERNDGSVDPFLSATAEPKLFIVARCV